MGSAIVSLERQVDVTQAGVTAHGCLGGAAQALTGALLFLHRPGEGKKMGDTPKSMLTEKNQMLVCTRSIGLVIRGNRTTRICS